MKKLLFVFLTLTLLGAFACFSASAEVDGGEIGNRNGEWLSWSFDTDSGELVISGNSDMDSEIFLNIPWDVHDKQIKSVRLENGITGIGGHAFDGCWSLTNVSLPATLNKIDYNAFSGCGSLEEIMIPEGVTVIGDSSFEGCERLQRISLPNSLKTLENDAFGGCIALESIVIPNGITVLPTELFNGCTALKSVRLPAGLIKIGWHAFENCKSLKQITLPSSVTVIENHAFQGCTALESIQLPRITYLGDAAFYECESLKSVVLPDSLQELQHLTFAGCSTLSELAIPASVVVINSTAIARCDAIKKIVYCGTNAQAKAIDGLAHWIEMKKPISYHDYQNVSSENGASLNTCRICGALKNNNDGYTFDTQDPTGTKPFYTYGTDFDGSFTYTPIGPNGETFIAQMGTAESSGEESSEGCGAALTAPAGLVLLLSLGIAPAFLRRRER